MKAAMMLVAALVAGCASSAPPPAEQYRSCSRTTLTSIPARLGTGQYAAVCEVRSGSALAKEGVQW